MTVSNNLALILAFLEVFLYAGVGFGYAFLQYIFEKENVFWDEVCYEPEKYPTCNQTTGKKICFISTCCIRNAAFQMHIS
jgi:hypothetical protein